MTAKNGIGPGRRVGSLAAFLWGQPGLIESRIVISVFPDQPDTNID
jgi:hypothetical protein